MRFILDTHTKAKKPGFFSQISVGWQNLSQKPGFFARQKGDRLPFRNRVSLYNLCHSTNILIETRFLG
jgi:hypothetical protein